MQIIKVPGINGLGKTKGCQNAGDMLLSALKEVHSTDSGRVIDSQILDVDEIHLDNSDIEQAERLIYDNALRIFDKLGKNVFLGGDHSISFPLVRAFMDSCRKRGKEPCLLVFDAHADCIEPMREPTHEEWLRAVIEAGFPPENILLIGARNIWKGELIFLNKNKIKIIKMNQLNNDLEDTCDIIMEFASGKETYISVDIDVIDPAFAPSTGYPEPGGISSRQFLYLIQRLCKIHTLKSMDIVEINAERDLKSFSGQTIRLGARILAEML